MVVILDSLSEFHLKHVIWSSFGHLDPKGSLLDASGSDFFAVTKETHRKRYAFLPLGILMFDYWSSGSCLITMRELFWEEQNRVEIQETIGSLMTYLNSNPKPIDLLMYEINTSLLWITSSIFLLFVSSKHPDIDIYSFYGLNTFML